MKISTILRRAQSFGEQHPDYGGWSICIVCVAGSKRQRDVATGFVNYCFDGHLAKNVSHRSLMLGLAAAIAESEGL